MSPHHRRGCRFPGLLLAAMLILGIGSSLTRSHAAEERRLAFALAAGPAEERLEAFSEQAGVQIVFLVDDVRGLATNPVQGTYAMRDALNRLVAGTGLVVMQEGKTGAFVIKRERPGVTPPLAPDGSAKNPPTTADPRKMKSKNPLTVVGAWLALALASSPAGAAADGALGPTGTIEGRVLNAGSKEYLERARVTVDGTTLETFTDAGGQFRLSGVPAGTAHVRVFFTGLDPAADEMTVRAGETTYREISLGAGRDAVRMSEFVVEAKREMDGAAIAINQQRFAPNITNVVAAGEFGISADGSVGEFIKYLPGISIDYVGGTANTVSLEGVPANNVPVTVAGFDLASTSSASTSRSTELLQISIQNMARLEVVQSPTPESPGSALSGSINLVPRSAFERSRPLFNGSAYLMMRDNYRTFKKTAGPLSPTYKIQPGFDFSYIVPVNRRFGFTLSGSYSKQFLPQDTVQTSWRGVAGATNGTTFPNTTVDRPYLTSFQLVDQIKFNDRRSLGASLDYKLSDSDTLSFSYQYGTFGSEYDGNTLTFQLNSVAAGNFSPSYTHGTGGNSELNNSNSARWRDGHTHMPSLIYRHNGRVWKSEAGAGYSYSSNKLRDITRGFFGSITGRRTGVNVSFDDIFYLRPQTITVTDNASGGAVNPYDLGSYVVTAAGSPNPRDSIDVKRSAYANTRRVVEIGRLPVTLKAGADVRQSMRDMRGSNTSLNFVGADNRGTTTPMDARGSDDNAASLLDAPMSGRGEPFGFGHVQWMSPQKTWDLYQAHPQYFVASPNSDYRNAVSLSKYAQETISSAFLRGDVALFNHRLQLVGGLRAEQTNVKAEGPLTDPTRNYQRDASGRILVSPTGAPLLIIPASNALGVSQLTFLDRGMHANKEYLRLFPSVNATYLLRENLVARAAFYTSVGRPDYNQYAGGITLPDLEVGPAPNNRITVNNVGIKAWSAKSTKFRLEYYFEKVGQVAVGVFRRDFKNFFGSTVFRATPQFLALYDLDPNVYGSYEAATQYNLPTPVRMTGFEFEYKQALTFLPPWARGLQVFTNLTALRTTGDDSASFSGYTPRTYNWGLSLNRGKFSLRAAWNYQSRRRLTPVTGTGIEPGTFNWRSKRLNLDVQGEYYLYRRIAVFANLRNLQDDPEDFEISGPNTPPVAQFRRREDYGASWTFGVKGTF